MKIHPAFPPVPCHYGAPMGRRDDGPSPSRRAARAIAAEHQEPPYRSRPWNADKVTDYPHP